MSRIKVSAAQRQADRLRDLRLVRRVGWGLAVAGSLLGVWARWICDEFYEHAALHGAAILLELGLATVIVEYAFKRPAQRRAVRRLGYGLQDSQMEQFLGDVARQGDILLGADIFRDVVWPRKHHDSPPGSVVQSTIAAMYARYRVSYDHYMHYLRAEVTRLMPLLRALNGRLGREAESAVESIDQLQSMSDPLNTTQVAESSRLFIDVYRRVHEIGRRWRVLQLGTLARVGDRISRAGRRVGG